MEHTQGFPGRHAGTRQHRVLVVEDVDFNRQILIGLLDDHGFEAVPVASGEEALARLEQDPGFSIILMDIGLPGMDGIEATRRIKKNPSTSAIPVVALTAHTEAERHQILAAGLDGFAEKNFDPDHLFREMSRHLDPVSSARKLTPRVAIEAAPLDLEQLRVNYEEDEIIRQIARAFFKDTDLLVSQLTRAVPAGDLSEIRACCHGISGAAMLFTADVVAEAAERMGSMARMRRTEEAANMLPELLHHYQHLRQWLRQNLDPTL
ncbi:MAG: Hpt domain-containing response regulator [Thermodesulfobacteriota bacterium]